VTLTRIDPSGGHERCGFEAFVLLKRHVFPGVKFARYVRNHLVDDNRDNILRDMHRVRGGGLTVGEKFRGEMGVDEKRAWYPHTKHFCLNRRINCLKNAVLGSERLSSPSSHVIKVWRLSLIESLIGLGGVN